MTADELTALLQGIAPALRAHVTKALRPLHAQLEALDARAPVPGPIGPQGAAGATGDPGAVGAAGPQGVPGERGERGADGAPGPTGDQGPAGPQGIAGRDGLPGVQGPVGINGADGRHGIDGVHGTNGTDGLGFDDIQVTHDGERGFTFTFVRGDQVKTFGAFTIPAVIYRGVYVADQLYAKGDAATWSGSLWVAQQDTSVHPREHDPTNRHWRLAVKAGRDGKEGKSGPQGDKGRDGRDGKDLTSIGPDGSKW